MGFFIVGKKDGSQRFRLRSDIYLGCPSDRVLFFCFCCCEAVMGEKPIHTDETLFASLVDSLVSAMAFDRDGRSDSALRSLITRSAAQYRTRDTMKTQIL